MFKTAVFRFLYLDRRTGLETESPDYATRKAIAAIGATAIECSKVNVDSRLIGFAGIVLDSKMPSGDDEAEEDQAERRESSA